MLQKVTLIGSFRKDPAKLKTTYMSLADHFEVLSPKDIDFVNLKHPFVRAQREIKLSTIEIEEKHLDAIRQSSFVWLFAPDGYVGVSAAFEIGFAHALGIPIYTDTELSDEMLRGMITEITPIELVPVKTHRPGNGVWGLQEYYKRIASERGWSGESARDTMLLLTEEIGELARAIRKTSGLKRDGGYDEVSLMDEFADVQLYLVHLAK